MGLPLLASDSTMDSFDYEGIVVSLCSPVPYEYEDANASVEKDGIFEIDNAQVIYMPPKTLVLEASVRKELTIAWDSISLGSDLKGRLTAVESQHASRLSLFN